MTAKIIGDEKYIRDRESVDSLQARRQGGGGGFEGVRANPPFDPQKVLYIHCYSTF